MSRLIYSKFNPARGGHAPGDLRAAFIDLVDTYVNGGEDDGPNPKTDLRGREVSLYELTGLLWNCRDIMPKSLCDDVRDLLSWFEVDNYHWNTGHTYAQGARFVRQHIVSEAAKAA